MLARYVSQPFLCINTYSVNTADDDHEMAETCEAEQLKVHDLFR